MHHYSQIKVCNGSSSFSLYNQNLWMTLFGHVDGQCHQRKSPSYNQFLLWQSAPPQEIDKPSTTAVNPLPRRSQDPVWKTQDRLVRKAANRKIRLCCCYLLSSLADQSDCCWSREGDVTVWARAWVQGKPYHGGTAKDNICKMPNKTKKEKVKYRLQS